MRNSTFTPVFKAVVAAFSLAAFAGNGYAVVFANDNFTNSSGSGLSSIINTESVGVGVFATAYGAGASYAVTTVPGFGSGNVLRLANIDNNNYRAFNNSATLALNNLGVNESLRLTFDVRFENYPESGNNFSFGFVSSSPAQSIGYANIDLNENATASEFMYRTSSFNMADIGTTLGSPFTSTNLSADTNYTMGFSITKNSAGHFEFSYSLNGVVQSSQTFLSNSTWALSQAGAGTAITGVSFRHSQTPGTVTYLDNVLVETVMVPETGTSALAATALGMLTLARRRTRRLA